jgi:O-antigen/teichoic acid export membrane protein
VLLCFYWLVFAGRALEGIVLAYAAAAGITLLVSCSIVFIPMTWKIDAQVIRPLIRFGAPLALASLSGWVLNSSDRYLLKWLSDPVVIAEYDWASRVAGVINVLLVQSFQLAFVVVGLQRLDENDVSLHREMFRHYVVWTGWAVLALSALTNDAMGVMAFVFGVDQTYVGISGLVLLVGIGFWFYGTNQIVASILASAGRTSVIAFCVGLAAFVNVLLNLLMIPAFGGMGAAAATAVAFLALVGTTTFFAEKRIPVGYEWSLPTSVLVFIVGLFLLCELSQGWHRLAGIWFRIAAVVGYMPLLIMTGKYRASEFRGGFRTAVGIINLRRG